MDNRIYSSGNHLNDVCNVSCEPDYLYELDKDETVGLVYGESLDDNEFMPTGFSVIYCFTGLFLVFIIALYYILTQ